MLNTYFDKSGILTLLITLLSSMFVHVDIESITMGCPTKCKFKLNMSLLPLNWESHHYILRDHMNEHTLLDNIMPSKIASN